jgi:lipoprotein-anchoring transpeptidase ErfK/SrfK
MINQDAIDLYQKTPAGTRVVVLASRGAAPVKLARQ